jgi:uncharacterized protein with von Willebrand factor type A (vWA) domain
MESKDVEMIDTNQPNQQPVAAADEPQANPGDLQVPVELKYFNLFDGFVQTQLSTQMTGAKYRNLIQENGEIDLAAQRERKRIGRVLFLCLDKSGSMSGTPYNALKAGSNLVAKSVFESKEFEHFITLFYDNQATPMIADTYEEYERKMNATNAGGGTSFYTCFNYIS